MKNVFLTMVLLAGVMIVVNTVRQPRGIRNNNPLNIRENKNVDYAWVGESVIDNDAAFEVFDRPEYGIRAAARILASYERRGLVTVEQIISTWAPSVENDTSSYINSVASKMGVNRNDTVSREQWPELLDAMIYHENGQQPYSAETIKNGISLA